MTIEEATERIKFLSDHACNYYIGRENGVALEIALEALKQPERQKGKWIDATDTSGGDYYRCSECGTYIEKMYFANDYMVNFCPNCGAKMEERTMTGEEAREALIQCVDWAEHTGKRYVDTVPADALKMALSALKQSEQKKGKWIEDDDYIVRGTCSCCGWKAIVDETDVVGMPFCPKCGAEMGETTQ